MNVPLFLKAISRSKVAYRPVEVFDTKPIPWTRASVSPVILLVFMSESVLTTVENEEPEYSSPNMYIDTFSSADT